MELKLVHLLGPILAITAMVIYGSIFADKSGRYRMRIFPTLGLVVLALFFRFIFLDGTFLDRICLVLMDFGIGLIVNAGYMAYLRSEPKVFLVPGILALVVSFGIYFIASLFGWTVNSMFAETETTPKIELAEALPPRMEESLPMSSKAEDKSQVLLELGPDDQIEELGSVLAKYKADFEDAFPGISLEEDEDLAQYFLVTLPSQNLHPFLRDVLKDKENVDSAEPNELIALNDPKSLASASLTSTGGFTANDPGIVEQWWMPKAKANAIHGLLKANAPQKKAVVAIVDSGLDGNHEDLSAARSGKSIGDQNGHGTHCAGLAGAVTNNGLGMASLNWEGKFIELRGYKGLEDNGSGSIWKIAGAITAAAKGKADVVSLSLGTFAPRPPKVMRDAVEFAQKQGCIVVAAAGNDFGEDAKNHSPSNIKGVIAVSAVNRELQRAPFSNTNQSLAMPLAEPGADIWSTLPNGNYDFKSGTSMATPVVAGLLGIVRAYNPQATAQEAWQLLHDNGQTVPASSEVGRVIDALSVLETLTGQKAAL